MSTVPNACPATAPGGWQGGFLSVLPAVQTHARIRFRRLSSERREEAITSACVSYQRLAAQGRLHDARPSTLATFAVNFVNSGRHVGGRQDAARDALSPVAQARHGFRATSLDVYEREAGQWRQVAVEDRRTPVPDLAAFRVDFARWLRTLTRRDRRIVAALAAGEGTGAVAARFGISPARVSQLRRKYEHLWHAFHGGGVRGGTARGAA